MFYKPTVFILGAGASWHYGYPTGEELVKMVIKRSHDLGAFCIQCVHGGNTHLPEYVHRKIIGASPYPVNYHEAWQRVPQECKDLEERLKQVNPPVIDYFLGQNPAIREIGKLIIALVILECEATYLKTPGNINRRTRMHDSPSRAERNMANDMIYTAYNDNWCRFVLYQLVSNCSTSEELLSNNVTFITFNYDISLEYKLYTGLSSIEQFQKEHIHIFFTNGRILHIYGKVREFPGSDITPLNFEALPVAGNTPAKYRSNPQQQYDEFKSLLDSVYMACRDLRVISDDKGLDDNIITQASDAVQVADTVYILGYGFDENNSKRLKLDTHLKINTEKYRHVFFTNFEDRNSVSKKASRLFSGSPENFLPPNFIYDPKVPQYASPAKTNRGYFEKSIRDVYEALERDFDW